MIIMSFLNLQRTPPGCQRRARSKKLQASRRVEEVTFKGKSYHIDDSCQITDYGLREYEESPARRCSSSIFSHQKGICIFASPSLHTVLSCFLLSLCNQFWHVIYAIYKRSFAILDDPTSKPIDFSYLCSAHTYICSASFILP